MAGSPITQVNEAYIPRSLGGLLNVAQRLSGSEAELVEEACRILLHCPPDDADQLGGRSQANWNGSPLQVLISVRQNSYSTRLIGDPAFYYTDPLMRLKESLKALDATLVMGQAEALRDISRTSAKVILPDNYEVPGRVTQGAIGLALCLPKPGAAIYIASESDQVAAWNKARKWATSIVSDSTELHRSIATLEAHCRIFGVGIEGLAPTAGRAKLYWRLSHPAPLNEFGISLYDDPTIIRFLSALMENRAFPLKSLTFSAGFSLRTGQLSDIKVDVCNNTTRLNPADMVRFIEQQTEILGLQCPPLRDVLASETPNSIAVGAIGLGLDCQGEHRLNTYLFQSNSST